MRLGAAVVLVTSAVLFVASVTSLRPLPQHLVAKVDSPKAKVVARDGTPLRVTYTNAWNVHEVQSLNAFPPFLALAFRYAEDKRFFEHAGVDWIARAHALWQNALAGRQIRGASTISEQVVRMLEPRPRTLWARWLEGLQAVRLERRFTKNDILEFYLNQVPYAANRRGVAQAARYYFDRSVSTLNRHEMLVLAVLVRAPSRLGVSLRTAKEENALRRAVNVLSGRLLKDGLLDVETHRNIQNTELRLDDAKIALEARHFVAMIAADVDHRNAEVVRTTLHPAIQRLASETLTRRVQSLRRRGVDNGAALVVDHRTNEVLAWAVANDSSTTSEIDAVRVPRQPGSALKPFLYANAFERGWSAATIIDDSPLAHAVGVGLHHFQNFSRRHYGRVTSRQALANSLNIPAVRTLQFVGVESFLHTLTSLGIAELRAHPDVYGDGLALGNGEVSLQSLVTAYSVLARDGTYAPLKFYIDAPARQARAVFSPETASLISDILSDADARALEFGTGGVLTLPVQTAVKTGTSNDYRDAWAVGYNYRYTVGVWLGNLDSTPMQKVTGATGPAPVLRTIFAELNRGRETRGLVLSSRLVRRSICVHTGLDARAPCQRRQEWFAPGTEPRGTFAVSRPKALSIRRPTAGLQLAMDPRIPDQHEMFMFSLSTAEALSSVRWYVNDEFVGDTIGPEYLWSLRRGTHTVHADVEIDAAVVRTQPVVFVVK